MLRTRLTRFACCVCTRARRVILLGKLGLQLGSQLIKPIYEHAVSPTAPPSIPLGHGLIATADLPAAFLKNGQLVRSQKTRIRS